MLSPVIMADSIPISLRPSELPGFIAHFVTEGEDSKYPFVAPYENGRGSGTHFCVYFSFTLLSSGLP